MYSPPVHLFLFRPPPNWMEEPYLLLCVLRNKIFCPAHWARLHSHYFSWKPSIKAQRFIFRQFPHTNPLRNTPAVYETRRMKIDACSWRDNFDNWCFRGKSRNNFFSFFHIQKKKLGREGNNIMKLRSTNIYSFDSLRCKYNIKIHANPLWKLLQHSNGFPRLFLI